MNGSLEGGRRAGRDDTFMIIFETREAGEKGISFDISSSSGAKVANSQVVTTLFSSALKRC